MVATLKKVDKMASDSEERMASALDKLREFEELGYPAAVRRAACLVDLLGGGKGESGRGIAGGAGRACGVP